MIKTKSFTLILPQCSICEALPEFDDWAEYQHVDAYYKNIPKGWVSLRSNVLCEKCMDHLRSMFMEEQKPKQVADRLALLEKLAKEEGKKEEHWITRNGTRVVVKMPLPAVGSIYSGSPVGMGEKPTLLRWDKNYNCVEVSWLPGKEGHHYELASYDLVERLEDSVKKEQG